MGVSAREMLDAIAECEEDPTKLANFARRTMKKKENELELSFKGYIHSHQRLMLKTILKHIDFLTGEIEKLDQEVAKRIWTHQEDVERLVSIPGIATRMASKFQLKSEPILRNSSQVQLICVPGQLWFLGITKVLGK
ncbi:hypothetical protein [Peribacillus butanolivorans]|uniref:hypothetical protein n=1 Tax=Peribacillus butanolivorans TaxID=421767 RepID=UPI00207C4B8C